MPTSSSSSRLAHKHAKDGRARPQRFRDSSGTTPSAASNLSCLQSRRVLAAYEAFRPTQSDLSAGSARSPVRRTVRQLCPRERGSGSLAVGRAGLTLLPRAQDLTASVRIQAFLKLLVETVQVVICPFAMLKAFGFSRQVQNQSRLGRHGGKFLLYRSVVEMLHSQAPAPFTFVY